MKEQFRQKSNDELTTQLGRLEELTNTQIGTESIREMLLSMDIDEIKSKYPDQYRSYLFLLQTEAQLLSFPDMDKGLEKPKISLLPRGSRGNSFKIDFGDKAHVVKPLESLPEKDIAQKASDLGIGPKQFKSKEGYLHEEFIDGTPLLMLAKNMCTAEYMEELGQKFGKAYRALHENNILVNDQILTDDFGKSHMIIDTAGEVRFVDFGASVDITDYPNLSDEAVLSLIRTDPFMAFRMFSPNFNTKEEQQKSIKGYRENILSDIKTKEALLRKDTQLLDEGLYFLRDRLPNVGSFIEGMNS